MGSKERCMFEREAWANEKYVCGIDEAGRGCLCGPLVAAAAIIPIGLRRAKLALLRDSKELNEQERNDAYEWIVRHCFFSYAIICPHTIDKHNIYRATQFAMKKSYLQLLTLIEFDVSEISCIVTDAVPLELPASFLHMDLELYHPAHAESLSPSVAAASIVAKVTRDRIVSDQARFFPAFEMGEHKGYGTRSHVNAIRVHGLSIVHRKTFVKNFTKQSDHGEQKSIC